MNKKYNTIFVFKKFLKGYIILKNKQTLLLELCLIAFKRIWSDLDEIFLLFLSCLVLGSSKNQRISIISY
jgi:hypothetical protein